MERTVPFVWAVYAIVVIWYLRQDRWKADVQARRAQCPWYQSKATPSFEDMLSALRLEIMTHRFFAHPLRARTLSETRDTLQELGVAA